MNIWYPVSLVLSAADTTLNKVLPINAAEPSSSCLDLYQSTPLTATADWSNGGNAADDAWLAVDVTDLLTYRSSDTAVAMVQTGALVKVGDWHSNQSCSLCCSPVFRKVKGDSVYKDPMYCLLHVDAAGQILVC